MSALILVVDDEPLLVETIAYNLERAGFRTLRAQDGEEALAQVRAKHPDLIILDVMLPKLSGLEVCREVRKEISALSQVPILMLTARSGHEEESASRAAGATDFMTKPFAMRDLLARVRKLLASDS